MRRKAVPTLDRARAQAGQLPALWCQRRVFALIWTHRDPYCRLAASRFDRCLERRFMAFSEAQEAHRSGSDLGAGSGWRGTRMSDG
jgi:hypothetical protein